MKHVKGIVSLLGERLTSLAQGRVVATEPISVGDRHVLALCELTARAPNSSAGHRVKQNWC